jgi:hypothetical protein
MLDMHREGQPSGFPSPLNHASNAHAPKWLATLVDKDIGRAGAILDLLPVQELEAVHLVPLQVMDAVGAALEPTDDHGPLAQIDVIPTKVASLADPQAVPVDQEADQPIAVTVPCA